METDSRRIQPLTACLISFPSQDEAIPLKQMQPRIPSFAWICMKKLNILLSKTAATVCRCGWPRSHHASCFCFFKRGCECSVTPHLILSVSLSHTLPLCDSLSLFLTNLHSYLLSVFYCGPSSAAIYPCLSVALTNPHKHAHTHTQCPAHTMRAWLISVSLPCFRKVLEQERPSERHFNPNYVDLKTALDTWGDRRWEGGGWLHSTHEYWWTGTLNISSHGSPHGESQPINFFGDILFFCHGSSSLSSWSVSLASMSKHRCQSSHEKKRNCWMNVTPAKQ